MKRSFTFLGALLGILLLCASATVAQDVQVTQSYVVQKGDTIGSIAQKFYGKQSLGASLWRANKNLVAHPKKLTAGDTIFIFPETTLNLRTAVEVPPAPESTPVSLYAANQLLNRSFPKHLNFVADLRGQGLSGSTRVRIQRLDPNTLEKIDQYFEVRIVGEIISSRERGATIVNDGFSQTAPGRTLLSTGDEVSLRITDDIAKILDSDTYEDPDPYFRSFPVYSIGDVIREPDKSRPDYGDNLGNIMLYKGNVTIAARVSGTVPPSDGVSSSTKRSTRNNSNGIEPVSYGGKIVYTEDPILVSDKVLLFVPLDPGAERVLEPPYVEPADTYVSPGK
jgi:hypothetical protein